MSTPTDPAGADAGAQQPAPPVPPAPPAPEIPAIPPVPEGVAPEATPTAPAYAAAPADAQPYAAAPAGAQPYGSAPYGSAEQQHAPAYGQPGYGQPGYGQAPYGQPPYGDPGAPAPSDRRPKVFAIVGLVFAVVGLLAAFIGFVPFVGLPFAIVAGILLLGGLVLSIIALASKKQGGKGLGIAGLVVSVVGGIVFIFALIFSIVFFVATANVNHALSEATKGTSITAPSELPSDLPSDFPSDLPSDGADGSTLTTAEQNYVDDVRPKLTSLMQEVVPGVTQDQIDTAYPDEMLVTIGQALLTEQKSLGDKALATEAKSMVDSSGGMFTEKQAQEFMQAILTSAQQYLDK